VGGTPIVITGGNFLGVVRVSIGGSTPVRVDVDEQKTRITMVTPPGTRPGAANIEITCTTGGGVTALGRFIYNGPASVTGVVPDEGPAAGGTSLTVTGSGFAGPVAVLVNGVPATDVAVDASLARLTCRTPAGTAGTVDVSVVSPATGTATKVAAFSYRAAPAISGIAPASGVLAGGTAVTIDGTGFRGAVSVAFGGRTATDVSVNAPGTRITCVTPPGTQAAAVAVTVTSSLHGTVTRADGYRYNPLPQILAVAPASGPRAGGTALSIDGSAFVDVTSVQVGGVAATNVNVDPNGTRITCVTPSSATSGLRDVVVISSTHGAATAAGAFRYNDPPALQSIAPASGPLAGGTAVVLTGTNLFGALGVTFGNAAATGVTGNASGTRIDCTVPGASVAAPVDVRVTSASHGVVTQANGYTYNALPEITNVAPPNGRQSGFTPLTIDGAGFGGTVTVSVGGSPATSVSVNVTGSRITCLTPAHAEGSVNVVVTSTTNGVRTAANAYAYNPLPAISSVTPSSGPQAGNTTIQIAGTSFENLTSVTVGGASATGVTVNGAKTQITCVTPFSATAGARNVVVTSASHGVATGTNLFTYNPPPQVGAVAPASGKLNGGTAVTITGSNFVNVTAVAFGSNPANGVVVNGPTQITCSTPASGAQGPVNVIITSSTHGVGTGSNAYTYNPFPTIGSVTPPTGLLAGGQPVVILGSGFNGTVNVTFGTRLATGVSASVSGTRIDCTSPPGVTAAVVDVEVSSSTHGSAVSLGAFTYNPTVAISSVTPSAGPLAGGNSVTVTGVGFVGTMNVTIGAAPATSVVLLSPNQLSCVVPAQPAGRKDVIITSSGSGAGARFAAYRYVAGPPSFAAPAGFATGLDPSAVKTADTNRDGSPDVITGNVQSSNASVLSGNGTGSLGGAFPINTGGRTVDLEAADMNRDGILDLVVTTDITNTAVSILTGNASGTFLAPASFAPGPAPNKVAVADFDRDGDVDVALTNDTATGFSVLLNAGGSLGSPTSFAAGTLPSDVVVLDLDRDGITDLAVSNLTGGTITLRRGTGTGSFGAATNVNVGANLQRLVAADLDGDGRTDLAGADGIFGLSVSYGDGIGGLTGSAGFPTALGQPRGITAADFNLDGTLDLATGENGFANVLPGNGNRTFQAMASPVGPAGTADTTVEDVNRDGRPDLVFVSTSTDQAVVMLNTTPLAPTSTFALPKALPPPPAAARALAALDANRDGAVDLAVALADGTVLLYTGTGSGVYQPGPVLTAITDPRFVVAADLDRNGLTDIVVSAGSAGSVAVLRATGPNSFAAPAFAATGATPEGIAVADLDGDGKLDLVVANRGANNVAVLIGDGAGGFAPAVTYPTVAAPTRVAAGDLDRDGKTDVLVASSSAASVSVLRNAGGGALSALAPVNTTATPGPALAIADFDRNGRLDFAVGTGAEVRVFDGTGGGSFSPGLIVGPFSSAVSALAIADINRDARPDLVVGEVGAPGASWVLGADGFFFFPLPMNLPGGAAHVVAFDHDGDGRPDVHALDATTGTVFAVKQN
jgi:hypothetical protein